MKIRQLKNKSRRKIVWASCDPSLAEEIKEHFGVEEGLEDIRKGNTYGPFSSAKELIHSLNQQKGNMIYEK